MTGKSKEKSDGKAKAADPSSETNTASRHGTGLEEELASVFGSSTGCDSQRIAELEEELAKSKAETKENLERYQRTLAEFDNYRKRTEREMADYRKFATNGLVKELLDVSDDLERALSTAKDPEDPLAVGVKAVRGNLIKILESQGVTEVPTDKGFDPEMHEALMVIEGEEDNKIAQVYQKGYLMNGHVLRFAKVAVTKMKELEAAPEQDEKTAENNSKTNQN